MKEPTNEAELKELHLILSVDPLKFLRIVDEWLADNPRNVRALHERHLAWMRLGEPRKALADMNEAVALDPDPFGYFRVLKFSSIWANTSKL